MPWHARARRTQHRRSQRDLCRDHGPTPCPTRHHGPRWQSRKSPKIPDRTELSANGPTKFAFISVQQRLLGKASAQDHRHRDFIAVQQGILAQIATWCLVCRIRSVYDRRRCVLRQKTGVPTTTSRRRHLRQAQTEQVAIAGHRCTPNRDRARCGQNRNRDFFVFRAPSQTE